MLTTVKRTMHEQSENCNREKILKSSTKIMDLKNTITEFKIVLGSLDIHIHNMILDPYLTQHTNINPKWIKDLNLTPLPIKFVEENLGEKLHGIGRGNDFMDMAPKVQTARKK